MKDRQPTSILLVDDRADKLTALEAVVADLGVEIVKVSSGREALRALLSRDFAVILLDVMMPGMDGFETAALLRQRKSSSRTPIIFVTSYSQSETDLTRGYSLGAVDFIHTPIIPQVLKSKIATFVDLFEMTERVKRQAASLERRAAQLHELTAASVVINSALTMDALLQVITDTAREITGAGQASTTLVRDRDWAQASYAISLSTHLEKTRRGLNRPDGTGVESLVCTANKPDRITRADAKSKLEQFKNAAASMPAIDGCLGVPLRGRDGRNMGLIQTFNKHDGDFTEEDEAILVQLAQMGSIAIENTLNADAQEANRTKDEFLATLSHELRTPLTALNGWVRILRTENVSPSELAYGLEVIDRNVAAQEKLIENLLDVSRILTGKLRLNLTPTSPVSIIKLALDAAAPSAAAKGVEIAAALDQFTDRVMADPDRLQQVMSHLLSNAIKFTPKGGRIDVRVGRDENRIWIDVADTGVGIKPQFLSQIFDRFRQADGTSTRSQGGLGLGLAIVRHLVTLHGGTVQVQSSGEGKGAIFRVNLPLTASAAG